MSPRVLVIDDNQHEIELLQEALRDRDVELELHIANCSHDALTLIEHTRPRFDLILLDINLPRVPGTEVARFLRANDELRRIPLLIFSGTPCSHLQRHHHDLSDLACREKPHSYDAYLGFVDELAALLSSRDSTRQPPVVPVP